MTMMHYYSTVVYSTIIFVALANSSAVSVTNTKPRRLVTKLVHRDSIYTAPYFSYSDRAKRDIETSITRFAYLSAMQSSSIHELQLTPAIGFTGLFYIQLSIGQPASQQLMTVMDTGSSLTWVSCHTCTTTTSLCDRVNNYDPSKSTSYATIPCEPYNCPNCNRMDQCAYRISYVRGPGSAGILSKEQLTFTTSDGGTEVIPNVTFGCGKSNSGVNAGIFGLGMDDRQIPSTSLITQLGSKFSYCLGNIRDLDYDFNRLVLGEGARMEGVSTPMEIHEGHYYIKMNGISIGGEMLSIDPNVFRKTDGGGVVIDSGTTYTWLVGEAYDKLSYGVAELVGRNELTRYVYSGRDWQLCYIGTIKDDLVGFPVVRFHFANEAELGLDVNSLFTQFMSNVFCMAVAPSYANGDTQQNLSVIGLMAQQFYNVGYDLTTNLFFFQDIECELLQD